MPPLNTFNRSLLAVCIGHAICATSVQAATITVTSLNDVDNAANGDCTLREAIVSANTNASIDSCTAGDVGLDTVVLGAESTINLTQPLAISVEEGLTLVGNSATIDANDNARHFEILTTEMVRLESLTLTNGNASGVGDAVKGGAIFMEASSAPENVGLVADLTIVDSRFTNNFAQSNGGAIFVEDSNLTVEKSTFSGNVAGLLGNTGGDGGAVWARGAASTVKISDSTFSDNVAAEYGGGVYLDNTVTLVGSGLTFEGNTAGLGGGGIYAYDLCDVTITNSSFALNKALGPDGDYDQGGAIAVGEYGDFRLINSTVSENYSANEGGGIGVYAYASLTLFNTIVAGNSAGIAGHEVFLHYGIDASYGYMNSALSGSNVLGSSLYTTDASLNGPVIQAKDIVATSDGPSPTELEDIIYSIDDNGGFTRTMLLPQISVAIDAGSAPMETDYFVLKSKAGKAIVFPLDNPSDKISIPDLDQRGFVRSAVDIGAVERVPSDPLDL